MIEAFLTGLEQARAAGRDLSGIVSVASFFVSRVDTEVDKRLDKLGTPRAAALRGKAAISNARLAYQRYERSAATGLVARDVVNTMPEATLNAVTGHGEIPDASWDHLGQRLATALGTR